jgi:hypothetical protein
MSTELEDTFIHGATVDFLAWHEKFPVLAKGTKPSEACFSQGLDFEVELQPLTAYSETYGHSFLPKQYAIMRQPTPDDLVQRWFGNVGGDYVFMQNKEKCDLFDVVHETFPMTSIGVLGWGNVMFGSFYAGELNVGGKSLVKQYISYYEKLDGKHKAIWMCSPIVQVCGNTCAMAQAQAIARADIKHVKGFEDQMKFKVKTLAQINDILAYEQALFGKMASTKIEFSHVKTALETMYTMPTEPDRTDSDAVRSFERAASKISADRARVLTIYLQRGEETPELANTSWNLWNAFTEKVNHYDDLSPANILFGSGQKEMNNALEICSTF